MKHLRRIFLKFYLLFANSKVEAELAREIGAHLALLEEEYLRQGMTAEGTRRAARLAYGGVEQSKQLHRDERGFQQNVDSRLSEKSKLPALCVLGQESVQLVHSYSTLLRNASTCSGDM